MDCSLPGSSVHGIFQARISESGAISFSRRATKQTVTRSISDLVKTLRIWLPKLPHYIIQNVKFKQTNKKRDIQKIRKIQPIHRKKGINKKYPWGSSDSNPNKDFKLAIRNIFKEQKIKPKNQKTKTKTKLWGIKGNVQAVEKNASRRANL